MCRPTSMDLIAMQTGKPFLTMRIWVREYSIPQLLLRFIFYLFLSLLSRRRSLRGSWKTRKYLFVHFTIPQERRTLKNEIATSCGCFWPSLYTFCSLLASCSFVTLFNIFLWRHLLGIATVCSIVLILGLTRQQCTQSLRGNPSKWFVSQDVNGFD